MLRKMLGSLGRELAPCGEAKLVCTATEGARRVH